MVEARIVKALCSPAAARILSHLDMRTCAQRRDEPSVHAWIAR